MTPLKKTGLVAAVLLFAALVCVPGVSAAGPGQGMPGNNNQGNDQGQHGNFAQGPAQGGQNPGQGNSQSTGQNTFQGPMMAPGQTQAHDAGNATGQQRFHGRDLENESFSMAGNSTAPGPMVLGNMTAFDGQGLGNQTLCSPPPGTNETDSNWTAPAFCQSANQDHPFPTGNQTEFNQTAPMPVDGNMTHIQARPDNKNTDNGAGSRSGNTQGSTSGQQGSSSTQDQRDTDLISAFLKWLRGGQ